MSYDAGAYIGDSGSLGLHRNENLFVPRDFFDDCFRGAGMLRPTIYPDSAAMSLKRKLADLHGVEPGNIHIGNGSDGVLSDMMSVLHRRYARTFLPEVGYKIYDLLAKRHRVEVSRYRADEDGRGPCAGLWLIDSPNAITGSVIGMARMERIAHNDDAFVIHDNCYGDYESERLELPDLERMAVVRSFSKYYGLAGLRVGYCIAGKELIAEIERKKDIYNVNAAAQLAAEYALDKAADFRVFAERMRRNRSRLAAALVDLGFDVKPPHGNFLFVHHDRHDAERLRLDLQDLRIMVRRFDFPETAAWLRITVPDEPDMEVLLAALRKLIPHPDIAREAESDTAHISGKGMPFQYDSAR